MKKLGKFNVNPRPPKDGVKLHHRNMREITPGEFYEGEWSDAGQRHGFGMCIRYDKSWKLYLYEGFWAFDKPHGRGRFIDGNDVR